jgi:outer membrane protein assembly factor BamB
MALGRRDGVAALGLFVVGCVLLAGCAARREQAGIALDSYRAASYDFYWETQLPLPRGDAVKRCHLVDDTLYVVTEDGRLLTLDSASGLLRWMMPVTAPDYTVETPRHLDAPDGHGPVVVVTTDRIRILDRYSGDLRWETPVPFAPGGGAVGDDRRLHLGSSDGYMYSLLWDHPYGAEPLTRWRLLVGAPVLATPSLVGNELVFSSQAGHVVAMNASDKTKRWVQRAGDGALTDPVVTPSTVVVASTDRSLYGIARSTGAVRWRHRFPAPLTDSPVAIADTCYQFCPGAGLTALNVDTGDVRWTMDEGIGVLAGDALDVVVELGDGRAAVVDVAEGAYTRTFPLGGSSIPIVNTRDKTVYLASPSGALLCLRDANEPYLRRQQMEAARAYLHRPRVTATTDTVLTNDRGRSNESPDPFRSPGDRP